MSLKYSYEKVKNGIQIGLEVQGDVIEVSAAIGRLIQQVFLKTPEEIRPVFRAAMQHVVTEDSPVWQPDGEESICIDVGALRRQQREANGNAKDLDL